MKLVAVLLLAGCGIGYKRVRTVEEVPAGQCPPLERGSSCERSSRDYSAGASFGFPRGHASDVAATARFRWPIFDVTLDERTVRKGDNGYHSLAGGIGAHLRPLIVAPRVQRYVDVSFEGGFDLGAIKKDHHAEVRGDYFLSASLELFAPDAGPLRYLETGVPGLRVGVRYTGYVNDWDHDVALEAGLVWHWGVPIDLYHHWTTQRTGD